MKNLSELFDRGEREGESPEERDVLQTYQLLQNTLRNYPVPELDLDHLVAQMENEYQALASSTIEKGNENRYRFFLKAAAIVFIFITAGLFYDYFLHTSPIVRIEQIPLEETQKISVSWLWLYQLHHGWTVTTPADQDITLHLSDNSTVRCSPSTQISINFDQRRYIDLDSGEILVNAASIKDSTMIVQTRDLATEVIGTEFRVKVLP